MEWMHQAFAALAAVDPEIIRAIYIGAAGVAAVLGITWIGRRVMRIKLIRHWGEAKAMKRKRQVILHEHLADDIEAAITRRREQNHITEQEELFLKALCARRLGMPDLLPKKNVDTVKKGIMWRLSVVYKKFNPKIPGPKPGEKEKSKETFKVYAA